MKVDNAGNAGDTRVMADGTTDYGSVAYDYRIGKYEVTVGQYTEFLNAVAATDTYALYNPSMATDLNIAGIRQSGVSGSYSYSVIGSPNKPVTYVSWGDAARFANWLHNGQPTGPQDASTTEDGRYTLNGATTDAALNAVTRNAGATWFIPTENEWYKAAYHKNDGVTGNYWDYPTATDAVPYSLPPPGSGAPTPSNTANFYAYDGVVNGYDDGWAVTGPPIYSSTQNYLTDVGAYTLATGPYGTFDQGGNVWEWNEVLLFTAAFVEGRGMRGKSWWLADYFYPDLRREAGGHTSDEHDYVGFRVAKVPEPSSLFLGVLAASALLLVRRTLR